MCICTKSAHDHDGRTCGKKIDDNEVVCLRCGANMQMIDPNGDMGLRD